jgi:pyruvate-formate lyase-activating enzyme
MKSLQACILLRKKALKKWLELQALVKNQAFFCNALSGNSDYNISINSDMTVSCNCQDFSGSGYIGDLSKQNFNEIFSGNIAGDFRRQLSSGKIPILNCIQCSELRRTDKSKASLHVTDFHLPSKGIMLENTICCNLQCLACPRKTVLATRTKQSLSLEDIQTIARLIRDNKIETLYLFKLGEPFISSNINHEITILRESNPKLQIVVSTNGILLNSKEKMETALKLDLIYFSIDGISDALVQKYQKNGSFIKAYENMKKLVHLKTSLNLTKPVIEWKYVLFNWNDQPEMIQQAIELARNAGVNILSFWPAKRPVHGISWKYHLHPYYKSLGNSSWKGREVIFS